MMILFVLYMFVFHIAIELPHPRGRYDLLRYIMGIFPVVIVLPLHFVRRLGGRDVLLSVALLFGLGALVSNFDTPLPTQPEVNLRGAITGPMQLRAAASHASESGDSVLVVDSHVEFLEDPALGYVTRSLPVRAYGQDFPGLSPGVSYTVISQLGELEGFAEGRSLIESMPDGSVLNLLREWDDGAIRTLLYRVQPLPLRPLRSRGTGIPDPEATPLTGTGLSRS